jgi:hypothetical protein
MVGVVGKLHMGKPSQRLIWTFLMAKHGFV